MKSIRFLVLVLLATLLPFRGAVAEALLCAGHAGHAAMTAGSPAHAGHQAASTAAPQDCEPAVLDQAQDHASENTGDHHGTPGAVAKCNTCTASCSMSPLVGEMAAIPTPVPHPDRHASIHDAPAPSHLTDGQERPPRSI